MKEKNKQIDYYLEIIDEIEKVRTSNNVNWMDILRLSLRKAPKESKIILKNINICDKKIANLLKKLS